MKTLHALDTVLSLALMAAVVWACAAAAAPAAETGSGEAAGVTQPPNTPDIIIGTVKRVSDAEGTNANPTPVIFEITETLKGKLKGTIKVAWREPPPGWDYTTAVHYGPTATRGPTRRS